MAHRTAQQAQPADTAPPDIAAMRAAVAELLGPDDGPDVFPPAAGELDDLTLQIRGHMELLVPEVEQAAARLPKDDIPRFCALACVGEARRKLSEDPRPGLSAAVAHARRLARSLRALVDHYSALSAEVADHG